MKSDPNYAGTSAQSHGSLGKQDQLGDIGADRLDPNGSQAKDGSQADVKTMLTAYPSQGAVPSEAASPLQNRGLEFAVAGVSLPEIELGRCAAVVEIMAADADVKRLMAMGVCVGRKVELVKAGDPLILRVLGCRIGVSARLARKVMVDPCAMPGCLPAARTPMTHEA